MVCLATLAVLSPVCACSSDGGDEESSNSSESDGGASAGGDVGSTGGSDDEGTGGGTGGSAEIDIPQIMSESFSMSEAEGRYTLSHGDVTMTIDPARGARITSFTVSGQETLVQEGSAAQYGTTFWPSPQIWTWPPTASIPEIDSEPYAVTEGQQRLTLTSEMNGYLGVIVTKTLTPARSESGSLGIAVTYTIQNGNSVAFGFAPWEVSRVGSGVVFYPQGPGGVFDQSSLQPESALDHGWYTYDPSGLEDVPKIFADGEDGWMAWAQPADLGVGAMVVKAFPDISQIDFADGEAEIEIYADPSGEYMEVEQQGAFQELAPGGAFNWTVSWYGAAVPESVSVESGNQQLIDLAVGTL